MNSWPPCSRESQARERDEGLYRCRQLTRNRMTKIGAHLEAVSLIPSTRRGWRCGCDCPGSPGDGAGLVAGEGPAGGLLGVVVVAAGRVEVAFAGAAAVVVGGGVVEVAAGGGAAAAGGGAGGVADLDEVAQGGAGLVAAGFAVVGAVAGLQGGEGEAAEPVRDRGAGVGPAPGGWAWWGRVGSGLRGPAGRSRAGSWSVAGWWAGAGGGPGCGPGGPWRAQAWATGCPAGPVRVTHHWVAGSWASRLARVRESSASRGP